MSSSTDGKTWSAVARIPIDATTSTVDHFLPGIGVDPTTSGANAHLTIVYYYYPTAKCTTSTCKLDVGFTTSTDGGATWTAGVKIAGPMNVGWLPVSDNGPMVADYIGVSYSNGSPFGVFAVAQALKGTTYQRVDVHNQSSVAGFLRRSALQFRRRHPVPNAKSDHEMKFFYDDGGHREIPRSRWITSTEPAQ